MLIHGRLILTQNGLMLDEVRSLLQKALRRPITAKSLALQSCKELIGHGKDQLPWKCIITFLFEDHCLSDGTALEAIWQRYEKKDKYGAIELLSKWQTCRIAACLPVIAMDEEYHPTNFNTNLAVAEPLRGLLQKRSGALNFDLLLANLCKAWVEKDTTGMISFMKLASIVVDHEKRSVTQKGEEYLLEVVRGKLCATMVVLSALYKHTQDVSLKRYLLICFKIATIREAPMRLVLFSSVAYRIYRTEKSIRSSAAIPVAGASVATPTSADAVTTLSGPIVPPERAGQSLEVGKVKWGEVEPLSCMPDWAIDKHTFRGKFGKGTKHLVKKKPVSMTEEQYDSFHGVKSKRDLTHFFDVCAVIEKPSVPDNPYWSKTKEHYFKYSKGLQKTIRMTLVFYEELKKQYPGIFYKSRDETCVVVVGQNEQISLKRKCSSRSEDTSVKEVKKAKTSSTNQRSEPASTSKSTDDKNEKHSDKEALSLQILSLGPLLQLPTGGAKVYTVLDENDEHVIKGPYREKMYNLTMFYHKAMSEVIKDPHTLTVTEKKPFIVFPLLRGTDKTLDVVTKPFYDAIARTQVESGRFVERGAMGIVQCHRLPLERYSQLPATLWSHYLYRYALNVGDSGLYNAITDDQMTFLFGIDMEESRSKPAHSNTLLHCMFTKLPRKAVCDELRGILTNHKQTLLRLFSEHTFTDDIRTLAETWGVAFDDEQYNSRINQIVNLLKK